MTEALIYVRFSTADQAKGHTIERQLGFARTVCQSRGLIESPALTFVEAGKSAFSGANRAKGSMLATIEAEIAAGAHSGRVLVVEHLDRISRQGHQEVTDFLRVCSTGGVSVATKDGDRFYPAGQRVTMMDIIEIILKAELARSESDNKSVRIRKKFDDRRKVAAAGGAKLIASRPPSWIRRLPDGQFELIEDAGDDRAGIVREAHRLAQMGYGTAQIAREFNQRNIPTWRGGSNGWHESYIARLLSMRTTIGEYTSEKHGVRILDYYPAVIDVDCYNRTQAARAAHPAPHRGRRGVAQNNILQGLVRCQCGGSMLSKPSRQVGRKEKRSYPSGNTGSSEILTNATYLRCRNYGRKICDTDGNLVCTNRKNVRYERVEAALLDKIMTLAMDNNRYNIAENSGTRIRLAEVERQLQHHRESLQNIKDNLKLKVSSTLMDMLTEIEDTISATQVERDALLAIQNRERGSQPSSAFLSRIAATRADMTHPDIDKRRDARTMVHQSLKEVITDIVCDHEGNTLVTIASGLAAFRINNAGVVDWQYDASNDPQAVRALTVGAFADNAASVETVFNRVGATPPQGGVPKLTPADAATAEKSLRQSG